MIAYGDISEPICALIYKEHSVFGFTPKCNILGSAMCKIAFEDEWEYVENGHLRTSIDVSQVVNVPAAGEDRATVFDLEILPEAEMMREACASGNLIAVQSVFQTQWLDQPADERIGHSELGASGLCEAIRRDDAVIAGYLLSNVPAMEQVHFGMTCYYREEQILRSKTCGASLLLKKQNIMAGAK